MRDTLPLLDQIPFPAIRRGRLDTLQVNVGYRCNQSCFHCHVNAGPAPHRGNVRARSPTWCSTSSSAGASRTLDITGGAPELNAHFRRLVTRRARARRQGDGPLQPHHPGAAGPGRPRRIPRRAAGRGRGLDALLSARTMSTASAARACSTARSAACKRLNALGYGRDSGARAQPRLQSARAVAAAAAGRARSRLQARARRAATASCSTSCYVLANMPIQRFGSMLISKGEFDGYLELLQARASRRQSRRRDVPQPDLGRLARLCLRLRLQPDARPAADARRRAAACICPICSTTTSTAIRSASPATATAAPPAKARAAAAR